MRNRNDKQAISVDLEQKVERKPGEHALADRFVEEGKGVRRTRNPCFRVLDGSQEAPSQAFAVRLVEPG